MANQEKSSTALWRIVPPVELLPHATLSLAAVGAIIGLWAGGNWQAVADGDGNGRDSASYIADLASDKRFSHDFAEFDASGDDCLAKTGYDLWHSGHNQSVAVGTLTVKDGIYIIEPGGDDRGKPALRLQADSKAVQEGNLPLQPATGDGQAAKILNHYECALTYTA